MSAIVVVNSSLASTAALSIQRQYRSDQCKLTLDKFDSKSSTVVEQKAYAECVQWLYPDAATGGELILLKFVVAATIVGGCVGAVIGYHGASKSMKLVETVAGLLAGIVTPPCVALLLFGAYKGIMFTFS